MYYISYRRIHGERYNQNTGQHVHDCDSQEEEMMGPVEMFAFLDDQTEEEVAQESDDDDDKIEDDVAPAVIRELLMSDLVVAAL